MGIMCLTEHWLSEDLMGVVNWGKYSVCASYCRGDGEHGGVLIGARNDIHARTINEIEVKSVKRVVEVAGAEIPSGNMVVIVVYRVPNMSGDAFGTFLRTIDEVLYFAAARYPNRSVCIAGDYNIDFLVDSRERRSLLEVLSSYGLEKAVSEPSRITGRTAKCIDNIFICKENVQLASAKTFNWHVSDHLGQLIEVEIPNNSFPNTVQVSRHREISEENVTQLREELGMVDWACLECLHARAAYTAFHDVLHGLFNDIMPEKEKMAKPNKQHHKCTEEVQKIKRTLDALNVVRVASGSEASRWLYQCYRERYREKIEEEKRRVNARRIENSTNKQRAIWDVIRRETGKNSKEIKEQSQLTSREMNSFFCNVGGEMARKVPCGSRVEPRDLMGKTGTPFASFFLVPTDKGEIVEIIKHIKPKETKDIYGFTTALLKRIGGEIAGPISTLVNKCMEEGVFPDELKVAVVTPIHKSNDRNVCSNYRPVSVLPAVAKIFEAVLRNRLTEYFQGFELFSQSQHGYRKNKSTTTALLQLVRGVGRALDDCQLAQVVACDLSKAFDMVSHKELLSKLEYYGVRGVAYKMFESYLENRTQAVRWNGDMSGRLAVEYGVPQGSMLGPLLFVIYTNDLVGGMSHCESCVLYADDTTFLVTGNTLEEITQKTENTLKDARFWFESNKLKMNESKTQVMSFCTRPGGVEDSIKLLGVYVDSRLSWSAHGDHLGRRLPAAVYAILRMKRVATHQCARVAYYTGFHSLVSYGIMIWGSSSMAAGIFRMQKRAVRALCGLRSSESCRDMFKREKILTVPSIYILACLKYVHAHGDEFVQNHDHHWHYTRYGGLFEIPYHRIKTTQQEVGYWGVKLYNHLPREIKGLALHSFIGAVRKLLLERTIYTMQEFFEKELPGCIL